MAMVMAVVLAAAINKLSIRSASARDNYANQVSCYFAGTLSSHEELL